MHGCLSEVPTEVRYEPQTGPRPQQPDLWFIDILWIYYGTIIDLLWIYGCNGYITDLWCMSHRIICNYHDGFTIWTLMGLMNGDVHWDSMGIHGIWYNGTVVVVYYGYLWDVDVYFLNGDCIGHVWDLSRGNDITL